MKTDTQIAYDSAGKLLRFVCTYCSRDVIIQRDGSPVERDAPKQFAQPVPYSKSVGQKVSLTEKYYDILRPRWDSGECGCGCGKPLTNFRSRWYREHGKTWRRRILRTEGKQEQVDVH